MDVKIIGSIYTGNEGPNYFMLQSKIPTSNRHMKLPSLDHRPNKNGKHMISPSGIYKYEI